MKLVVGLRDPVERAFSAWNMYRHFGDYRPLIYGPKKEVRDFDLAVREEIEEISSGEMKSGPGYVRRGLYYEQLVRYFDFVRPSPSLGPRRREATDERLDGRQRG